MSSSLLPTTSGGAHICPSPPRPRRRRRCQVIAAASAPPASDGVGRRAVSLAGVAAWLATTVGRKYYNPVLFYVSTHLLLLCYSAVRDVRVCLWLICCAPTPNCCRGRRGQSIRQVRQEVLSCSSCPHWIGLLQAVAFDLHNSLIIDSCFPWTATVRKKLEPLETYVPAVLLTIDQFVDLGNSQVGWSVSHGVILYGTAAALHWCKISI